MLKKRPFTTRNILYLSLSHSFASLLLNHALDTSSDQKPFTPRQKSEKQIWTEQKIKASCHQNAFNARSISQAKQRRKNNTYRFKKPHVKY